MYREFIIFGSIVIIALFMSIHNSNQETINQSNAKSEEHKNIRDNLLMKEGSLLKVGNGVTFTKNADLIFVKQSNSTIIINQQDTEEIVVSNIMASADNTNEFDGTFKDVIIYNGTAVTSAQREQLFDYLEAQED